MVWAVSLENVSKSFGDFAAVKDFDLNMTSGEFVTLLGPSGCGKTTCLRMIAGFVLPTRGRVFINGRDVTYAPPHRRNTGMVFQSYALFPHKTVAANIAFGLHVRRTPRADRDKRVQEIMKLVRLEHMADRYPHQLSGGQRQRVALARAVVIRPQVLLLDEPLAALDLKLREELQVEIKRVQTALDMTTLFVTHDQGEALSMSHRVAVMRAGELAQIGDPIELYNRPNSRYVANFLGRTNLIDVIVTSKENDKRYKIRSCDEAEILFDVEGPQSSAFGIGERCHLAARPEQFVIGREFQNQIEAMVMSVTYRGSIWNVEMKRGDDTLAVWIPGGGAMPKVGQVIPISWRSTSCFLLKSERSGK